MTAGLCKSTSGGKSWNNTSRRKSQERIMSSSLVFCRRLCVCVCVCVHGIQVCVRKSRCVQLFSKSTFVLSRGCPCHYQSVVSMVTSPAHTPTPHQILSLSCDHRDNPLTSQTMQTLALIYHCIHLHMNLG